MLEQYCRYNDLKEAGIVNSHTQLRELQEKHGLPLGRLLGPNTRVWSVSEIKTWLAARPTGQSNLILERAAKSIAARRAQKALAGPLRRGGGR